MSEENNKEISIAVPGEWVLRKVLGPIFEEIGSDLKTVYSIGRDKIISSAIKKIINPEDGAVANLRVARDVFWNGSFTDESICAEYFGGILAASRTFDGKDDGGIYYLDIIKSLSSAQLHLHYIIYYAFNKLLVATQAKNDLNVGAESEMENETVCFLTRELEQIGLKIDTDLEALHAKGLISGYRYDFHKLEGGRTLAYTKVRPTALGVHLFAVAFNYFSDWRNFPKKDFGEFESIKIPRYYNFSIEELAKNVLSKR